ncbi:L-threonylcarbamoyladenylate synthase [Pseudoflavonifractor sp. 60]|uniref:L-threonylcarbamoyladenylate synthase n=1 Tax=Pseudoflavonifractor sp. 60 TaxID=2304576 RepID=UPI00136CA653|nr:L-threonylcarbamoyladenylate synthase [Pseudoflavonifractor sp. 60]NBI68014.1 L-threonylcarbamoyladenylate synthase [Pseudoflavonifractor sp. 60]
MKTELLNVNHLLKAAEIIRGGDLLGIPTETVYGLGADGLNSIAVGAIFQAKGRPQDNPLILHVWSADWLARYCEDIPESAYQLAEQFWPGPLTMVLKCRRRTPEELEELKTGPICSYTHFGPRVIPDVVTAGLDTVGMRCPAHSLCRHVIQMAQTPIAAPSGNTSGRPSPTTAQHMLEDMGGKIPAILDGGPCTVGVESTIIDLTCMPPRLLRPGGVTLEQLQAVLGKVAVDPAVTRQMAKGEQPRAPGMKYRHYAPKAPVVVVRGDPERGADYIRDHMSHTRWDGVICFEEFFPMLAQGKGPVLSLGPVSNKGEQARRLFDALRSMDETDVKRIWAQCPDDGGIGLAVANRLNKAAGFHIIEV